MKYLILLLLVVSIFVPDTCVYASCVAGEDEFICFLRTVARTLFKVVIFCAILLCGPYCLVKGFVLLGSDQRSQDNPIIYICVGIFLLAFPIFIAIFIKTLQSSGDWGVALADMILKYLP